MGPWTKRSDTTANPPGNERTTHNNIHILEEGEGSRRGSTAGLPTSETHTKNQFASEPEGLRQFRDHRWKALDEENLCLLDPVLYDPC